MALLFTVVMSLLCVLAWNVLNYFFEFGSGEKKVYPPGPVSLPIVGNFPQIDLANPFKTMIKWKRRYGEVFTVWLPKPVVVLAGNKALHEALVVKGDHFAGRPTTYLYAMFTNNQPDGDGIILCRGPRWQAQRRIALRALRGFGMGKRDMEERILYHTRLLLDRMSVVIRESKGVAVVDMHYQLAFLFGNIIHDLVMGRRYDYDDAEFIKFKRMLDNTLEGVASVEMLLVNSFPWMRFFLPRYKTYLREGQALQQFFREEIARHEKAFDPDKAPDNFIDFYLKTLHESDLPYINRDSLAINAGDLWTGGLETVVTTLRWAIIYMINNPRVQRNVQAELDSVVGRRPLALADRANTPYLHAVLDELQRIVNVLPWHIPHTVDKEVLICGTLIPKDAIVMPQPGAVTLDEHVFPQPHLFQPERFLDPLGHYCPSPHLAAFGLGKRACPGEGLARMELYLVLGSLLQELQFRADPMLGAPSLERCMGMTSVPQATSYMVVRRFAKMVHEF